MQQVTWLLSNYRNYVLCLSGGTRQQSDRDGDVSGRFGEWRESVGRDEKGSVLIRPERSCDADRRSNEFCQKFEELARRPSRLALPIWRPICPSRAALPNRRPAWRASTQLLEFPLAASFQRFISGSPRLPPVLGADSETQPRSPAPSFASQCERNLLKLASPCSGRG